MCPGFDKNNFGHLTQVPLSEDYHCYFSLRYVSLFHFSLSAIIVMLIKYLVVEDVIILFLAVHVLDTMSYRVCLTFIVIYLNLSLISDLNYLICLCVNKSQSFLLFLLCIMTSCYIDSISCD